MEPRVGRTRQDLTTLAPRDQQDWVRAQGHRHPRAGKKGHGING